VPGSARPARSYKVVFEPQADKELRAVDPEARARILKSLARLAADPHHSSNVKMLRGGGYRLRVGDWRVLYTLEEDLLLVLVLKVGHRREVYRN
jgi:mRNA interferase RelE/StbE